MARWIAGGMGLRMRGSLLFFALSSGLDELGTFINLAMGGVEFNPRVAGLLSVHPLLYPLLDIGLILISSIIDRSLRDRVDDVWLIWVSAGIGRLVCAVWGLS